MSSHSLGPAGHSAGDRRSVARRRTLRLECLEARQLLAGGLGFSQAEQPTGAVDRSDLFVLGTTLQALSGEVELYQTALRAALNNPAHWADQNLDLSGFATRLPVMVSQGKVVIDATAAGDPALLVDQFAAAGAIVTGQYGRIVSALVPLEIIASLAGRDALKFARPAVAYSGQGATTTQGDAAMESDLVRAAPFGLDGSGVSVGILSDSYNLAQNNPLSLPPGQRPPAARPITTAAQDIASGDLPGAGNPLGRTTPVNVVADNAPVNYLIDEGRAMLQIVHDVAPGAALSFATAFNGQASFAANIAALVAAGSDVIVDDVFYNTEPFFQDGVIAQAVDAAVNAGVSYFALANNHGRNSYDSAFRAGTNRAAGSIASAAGAPAFLGGVAQDFDPGAGADEQQGFSLNANQTINLSLQWDQPFFSVSGGAGSANDVDLYVLDATGQIVAGSTNNNTGGDPSETLSFTNTGAAAANFSLMIVSRSGAQPGRVKYLNLTNGAAGMGALEFNTNSGTAYGHANANLANSVGAADYRQTPRFGVVPPQAEGFSSAGGIPILFNTAGNAVAPINRQSPNIVAPNKGNTTFFLNNDLEGDGFLNFSGTSAAAPHAGALAALLLQQDPTLSPAQVKSILQTTALDMDDPFTGAFDVGADLKTGFGLVQGIPAILAVAGPDRFEANDSIATATVLGSEPSVTLQDLTIDPAGDQDLFRVTAHDSGSLIVRLLFDHTVGNLDLEIRDRNNNLVTPTASLSSPAVNQEELIIPVVSQQPYFVRVFGVNGAVNVYDLEIENFPAPVPDLVLLDPADDSGSSSSDDITNLPATTVFIQADLSGFAASGIAVLDPAGILAKLPGAAVQVFLLGSPVGFASPVAGSDNTLFQFDFPLPTILSEGVNHITAAVRMFDGRQTAAGARDPASGRSPLSSPLLLTFDQTLPTLGTFAAPDMLASSDSGASPIDNVTTVQSPTFVGLGEANVKVRILANLRLVGQGIVLSDSSDGVPGDGLGAWQVATEPLADGRYDIVAEYEDAAGNITRHTVFAPPGGQPLAPLPIEIDTLAPNTAYLDVLDASDTGRNNFDDVTRDNTPDVGMTTLDPHQGTHLIAANYRYRIFNRPGGAVETLLYDSLADAAVPKVDGLTALEVLTKTLATLADGVHNLKLEVEDRAGNISADFLLPLTIDTLAPANPTIRLEADSDSSVAGNPQTLIDAVTSDSAPGFSGRAEADSIVRLWADAPPVTVGFTAGEDRLIGLTVAVPGDGNGSFPNGQWNLLSQLDLNSPAAGFPLDGWRQIIATAEDLAGNESSRATPGVLDVFIDTLGPQISAVLIPSDPAFNLFRQKPDSLRPTPLVRSLSIEVIDTPGRDTVNFPNHFALDLAVAQAEGHYLVRGDHVGVVAINNVVVTLQPLVEGQPARATITLNFAEPLPDDRYTISVADALVDPAGNRLDGEIDLIEPDATPVFPSGDLQTAGSFAARFTVDSRPEIGTWAAASVFVDINGNGSYDPPGETHDASNRDLVFTLGLAPSIQGLVAPMGVGDRLLAGDFRAAVVLPPIVSLIGGGPPQPAFDKLAAYGYDNVHQKFRWLIDTDHDGTIDPAKGDRYTFQPAAFQLDGLPVAGNFDRNAANGDEIGLYVPTASGSTWYFDLNKDFVLDAADVALGGAVPTALKGTPIAGDFDGNGVVDLATWRDNVFYFALATGGGWSAVVDYTIDFGFPGVAPIPIAADMDQDGISDLGLFVPRRSGSVGQEEAEWYFLISGQPAVRQIVVPLAVSLDHPYSPTPLGRDWFFQFGDEFSLPLVGNFDPPVTPSDAIGSVSAVDLGSLLGPREVNGEVNGAAWYRFTPLRDGQVQIAAEFDPTGGALQMTLYDAGLVHLTTAGQAAIDQAALQFSVRAGQTYAVRLTGRTSALNLMLANEVDEIDRLDATRDRFVSPLDALVIINALNAAGPHSLDPLTSGNPELFLDTTLDGQISPLDVLHVVNYLNAQPAKAAAAVPRAIGGATSPGTSLGPTASDEAFSQWAAQPSAVGAYLLDDLALPLAGNVPRPTQTDRPRATIPIADEDSPFSRKR